eukprot:Clim_evm13s232 gene=Clim_evmTU13s232
MAAAVATAGAGAKVASLTYANSNVDSSVLKRREEFEDRFFNMTLSDKQESIENWDLVRTLGTGSFGRVMLARRPENKASYFALKILRKDRVVKTKQVEHTLSEKSMLAAVQHPFIIQYFTCWQDTRNLYIVLEYVNGGELFTHLHRQGRFNSKTAAFYVGQVVLAFEYLHSLDIVYRDLKPENLLLDSSGYLRVVDFGFAKRVTNRTWTLCGTPEYLAPEIILSKGYGTAVDWWAVGILTYELMCGGAPFVDQNPLGIYEKILKGKIRYPSFMDDEAKHLISKLCVADLTLRYGNIKGGVAVIKGHPWFGGPEFFQDLLDRKIAPPVKPRVSGDGDHSNFDRYPEEQIKGLPAVKDPYEHLFKEF